MDGRCRTCHSEGPCVCERVCASVCVHVRVPLPRVGTLCTGAAGTRRPLPAPPRVDGATQARDTACSCANRPRPRVKGRTPSRHGQGPVPRACDTGRFQHRTREPLQLWIQDAGGRGGGGSSEPDGDPEGLCCVPLCAEIALGDNAEPQLPPGSRRTAVPALALATRPGERPPGPARHFAWVVCTGYGFASSGCGDPRSGAVDATAPRHSSSTLPAARSHPASRGFGNTKPHLLRRWGPASGEGRCFSCLAFGVPVAFRRGKLPLPPVPQPHQSPSASAADGRTDTVPLPTRTCALCVY